MANIERLKALRQRILDHKDQFSYRNWYINIDLDEDEQSNVTCSVKAVRKYHEEHPCGTMACVAGWAIIQGLENKEIDIDNCQTYIEDAAEEYLDLTTEERRYLFLGRDVILYGEAQPKIELAFATVEDAIERLDHIIDHHENLPKPIVIPDPRVK